MQSIQRVGNFPIRFRCGLPNCSPSCDDQVSPAAEGFYFEAAVRSPLLPLDMTTAWTELLVLAGLHPLEWQLASLLPPDGVLGERAARLGYRVRPFGGVMDTGTRDSAMAGSFVRADKTSQDVPQWVRVIKLC
jgi:hypothetical protein